MLPFLFALLFVAASASASASDPATAKTIERGRVLYAACAACHTPHGATQLGPDLRGVVGRPAAGVAGFRYSRAMRRSGLTWDEDTLDRFLADPQALVPGNAMPYAGEPDPAARSALVAYLKTLDPVLL